MKRHFFKAGAVVLMIYVGASLITNSQTPKQPTASDVKIRQRMGSANGAMESTLYIKGPRMRTEMGGNLAFITILQCDLKRTLTINEKTRTYLVTPTDEAGTPGVSDGGGAPTIPPNQQVPAQTRGGVVNITNMINDTGERKEMFGFMARRIKTSMTKTATPDACDKDQKIETDGWYIDFQYAFQCPGQRQKYQPVPVRPQPGCKDEIRMKTIGSAKLGFPLLVTTTLYQPDGRTISTTQEVLELSRELLSASLFDAPEGYTLAKDAQELYGVTASGAYANNTQTESNKTPASSSVGVKSIPNNSTATTNASSPKKPGVIRIGLILPKVQMNQGNAAQAAEAIRNTFAGYLTGPTREVINLSARLPSLALEEARQSQCDYLLSVSMTIKKGGGGGSLFGRAIGSVAGTAAGHIPGGGSAATGAARSAVLTGIYSTAAIASSIKARDEVALEYKLEPTDAAREGVANTAKSKASSDGDDVLTPLVEKAAGVVVSTISKK